MRTKAFDLKEMGKISEAISKKKSIPKSLGNVKFVFAAVIHMSSTCPSVPPRYTCIDSVYLSVNRQK